MNRRAFLQASMGAPALSVALPAAAAEGIVDTHVYLSRWPTRRLAGEETPQLVALLRERGVTQAWAGSFEALLHKDVGGVNRRIVEQCERHGRGFLLAFGTVNPLLPGWEEELRRCRDEYNMPGIRVHPSYQGYTLQDPAFGRLLQVAAEMGLLVQMVAWMEDERCQVPLLRVASVDLTPLPALLEKTPGARVMVLNGFINANRASRLLPRAPAGMPAFDFAMLDGLAHLRAMVTGVGLERVVFGSCSPMFYFESALLKMREADITDAEGRAIFRENARRLLHSSDLAFKGHHYSGEVVKGIF